jgi:rhamnose transport system permease protein
LSASIFRRIWFKGHAAGLTLLTAVLFVAVTVRYPQFASVAGLRDSMDDTAILLLMALGQMSVILTRAIDLSIAANLALSGLCVALINHANPELPLGEVVLMAIGIGACLGSINGLLVWQMRIPPIVATLGTLAIFRGSAFLLTGGKWVNSGDMSPAFVALVRHTWMGISLLSWFAIGGIALAAAFLRYSALGRNLYAAGNNPEAAAYVGIDVGRAQCIAFIYCGAAAGLCGYLWAARFAVAYADMGSGFELLAIAACVLGGISIRGGIGTVWGMVVGCLFLGVIRNALPLLGVSAFWQMAMSGAVIVASVLFNAVGAREPRQRILERGSA